MPSRRRAPRGIQGKSPRPRSVVSTTENLRIDVWSDGRGFPLQLDVAFTYEETWASPAKLLTETKHERLLYSESIPRLNVPNRRTVTVAPNLTAAEQLEKQCALALDKCPSETPICAESDQDG
jgi:hypothetical protein